MDVVNNFIALGFNSTVYLYGIKDGNYAKFLNVSVTYEILSIAINENWLIVINSNQTILQFELVTGKLFSTFLELNSKILFYSENSLTKIATYSILNPTIYFYTVDNIY